MFPWPMNLQSLTPLKFPREPTGPVFGLVMTKEQLIQVLASPEWEPMPVKTQQPANP
jgi:hypothetical protein